jgi:hypothetical protein
VPAIVRALLLALAAALLASPAAGEPRCFGAASRDPAHPCSNPALTNSVTPTPQAALRAEAHRSFCGGRPVRREAVLVCPYGPVTFTRTVAILGDSHADHLRAAWQQIADEHDWRIDVVYRPACPFSRAHAKLPPARARGCEQWNRTVPRFFAAHPEIRDVVLGAHVGYVRVPKGSTRFATQVRGYVAAWRTLPTRLHLVVLRDPPKELYATVRCIERTKRSPGTACALRRSIALDPDPQVAAARRRHVPVVDLTRFYCDARNCFPVIGGVLVHRDVNHLSERWAATLAPYLDAALARDLP